MYACIVDSMASKAKARYLILKLDQLYNQDESWGIIDNAAELMN